MEKNYLPFFYDITLRDGNQALKRPWNLAQKEIVFNQLIKLGVQGIEVGFPGAGVMDFDASQHLAKIAPDHVVISGLARCTEMDIRKAAEAVIVAAQPRIHVFVGLSRFVMENVLKKSPHMIQDQAVESVVLAKKLLAGKGSVQFSAEHFGDCDENIDFVIETFLKVIDAGATVINLPNTVERTRPASFLQLVEKVAAKLPCSVTLAVHCHNDLGMATATTVESYFRGITQLECSLNGLGERAGNTNLYEVAISLHNSGVNTGLNLNEIYETALLVSELSNVAIPAKAPLVGQDAMAHRSGIHQDGAFKTKDLEKGAYRPIHPSLIGLLDGEYIGFTSQSGKTAIYEVVSRAGWPISIEEATYLQPLMKAEADVVGELSGNMVLDFYKKKLFSIDGPVHFVDFTEVTAMGTLERYQLTYDINGVRVCEFAEGDGPIDACLAALQRRYPIELGHYEQMAIGEDQKGSASEAMTIMKLRNRTSMREVLCRGLNPDTRLANILAIFNGINLLEK